MKQLVVVVVALLGSILVPGCAARPVALGSGRSAIPPRPAGATYPGWEHHCAAVDGSSGQAEAIAKLLADAGMQGWELVLAEEMSNQRYFCFKRPLFDPANPSMVFEGGVEPSEAERAAAIRTAREAGVLAGDDVVWEDVIASGIRVQADGIYEISRDLIDKLLANPMAMAKGARVVPAMKDGKTVGFKVYAIRARSLYARLGLENGDTVESINGFALSSADQALEVYVKLREAVNLELELVRRGKPVRLRYVIN